MDDYMSEKMYDYERIAVPAKVRAAMEWISFCRCMERGATDPMTGIRGEAQDLTKQENGVKQAAMVVLLQYFTGEHEFMVEPPPPPPEMRQGDEPQVPVPSDA